MDQLCRKLKERAIPYATSSGMAVNARRHQRTMTDIDVLLTPDGMRRFKLQGRGAWSRLARSLRWQPRGEGHERGVLDILLTATSPS